MFESLEFAATDNLERVEMYVHLYHVAFCDPSLKSSAQRRHDVEELQLAMFALRFPSQGEIPAVVDFDGIKGHVNSKRYSTRSRLMLSVSPPDPLSDLKQSRN